MTLRPPRPSSVLWGTGAFCVAALVALPLWFIIQSLFQPATEGWELVSEFLLRDYIVNTLIMIASVGVLTTIVGVSCAWMVTAHDFPGRAILTVALMFPLAIPTYVAAYGYGFLIDMGTPLLVWVRESYGPENMALVDRIRTYTVAAFVLSSTLFPYVYIGARISFADCSQVYLESSRLLGRSTFQTFLRVGLPLARPGIIGGVTLVLMEVLNEYGAMQYFGINTFTTGIFLLWSNMEDLPSAVRLSAIMLLVVFGLILLERITRGRRQSMNQRGSRKLAPPLHTPRRTQMFCWATCTTVFLLTFIVPVVSLARMAAAGWTKVELTPLLAPVLQSIGIAGLTATLILACAFFLAYATRLLPNVFVRSCSRIALLGYALPGAVIAVAILVTSGRIDAFFADSFSRSSLLLTGTTGALVLAYLIRFLAVGLQPIEAGMKGIDHHLDEASATLGRGRIQTFFRVHMPMMTYPALGALMMLFIDLNKELPLTLILRPFGLETLATKTYGLIQAEERLAEGAVPALLLIAVGLIGVMLLRRLILKLR